MSTLHDNINDITLYINDRKAVKMNVFSLFYTVMLLDISLMVYQANTDGVPSCEDKEPVVFFCANTTTFGSSVFLDTSSKVPLYTNVSCRCDLRAPDEFYLVSLNVRAKGISDITVNGASIMDAIGVVTKQFHSMSIHFRADTESAVFVCIGVKAVSSSTNITAQCFTHEASDGNGAFSEDTTKGHRPVMSTKPHGPGDKTTDDTKHTDTNIGIIMGAAGGATVVLVVVILTVVCFYRRSDRKRKHMTKAKQPDKDMTDCPKEDMTECAMYSSADDDQEKGGKKIAVDGSKYSTEPEYSYTTVNVPCGETNGEYEEEEDDYNHLHQQPPRKWTENVYTVANFKVETKENENETNDYKYSTVQKPRAGK